jgi:CxxC motif-containing protein (DUF1111 family)
MAALSRQPTSWGWLLAVALVLVPAWKCVEPLFRSGPTPVSREASRLGGELFVHRWTERDPSAGGDGLGPVFNASSCVECHNQGGVGGGGPAGNNVTVYSLAKRHPKGLPQSGVVHAHAINTAFQETLRQVHSSLPSQTSLSLAALTGLVDVSITQRNTPALFGDGQIDAIADDDIIALERKNATARIVRLDSGGRSKIKGRVARLADGRIGRFGWKLEFATLGDFVKAACANELGLSNPGRPQATPLGHPEYRATGVDLTDEQCGLMADFIRGLAPPFEAIPRDRQLADKARTGKSQFRSIGCADCHSETLGPAQGLYSDLLLHDLGSGLEGRAGYAARPDEAPSDRNDSDDSQRPSPSEWRTAPLWGVADSAPYLHDGRAVSLEQAIQLHGGEASGVSERFQALAPVDKLSIISFLNTLRAPVADPAEQASQNLAVR